MDQEDKKPVDVEPIAEFVEKDAIKNVSTFASEKLGDIIVMHRYLGLYPELSIQAMKELAARRELGDKFLYEEYIASNLDKLPKLNFEIPPLNVLLERLKKIL